MHTRPAPLRPNDSAVPPRFSEPVHVGRPNICDRHAFLRRVQEILDRRWLSNNGPVVQEFERAIEKRLGVRHVIAVCNGTVALEVAIRAMNLRGEVIVPSYTFVATAHAVRWMGLTPVFADIDSTTHNLDPAAVERAITPRTTGIIGVHLWGRPAPVDALQAIADSHGLALCFDAAHAFGCTYKGTSIGNFGRCEVFSFHATKFFNTFEGGAITTNDDALAARIRLMINFGFSGYDNVVEEGTNGKMTEICAAMGLTGLESLPEVVAVNRRNHQQYRRELDGQFGIRVLEYDAQTSPNYQYVVAEVGPSSPRSRDELVEALHAMNVLARRYFWPGIHRMSAYREAFLATGARLPHTEVVADKVIVLPTGTDATSPTVSAICATLLQSTADHLEAKK